MSVHKNTRRETFATGAMGEKINFGSPDPPGVADRDDMEETSGYTLAADFELSSTSTQISERLFSDFS